MSCGRYPHAYYHNSTTSSRDLSNYVLDSYNLPSHRKSRLPKVAYDLSIFPRPLGKNKMNSRFYQILIHLSREPYHFLDSVFLVLYHLSMHFAIVASALRRGRPSSCATQSSLKPCWRRTCRSQRTRPGGRSRRPRRWAALSARNQR